MTLPRFSLVVVLFLCASAAFAGVIDPNTIRATDEGSRITVYWQSVDETGVVGYLIARRKGGSDNFDLVNSKSVKGSGTLYDFPDETAFKSTSTFYQYRITPVDQNGRAVGDPYYVSATKKDKTGIQKTWGSIKAMFR